jgi:hypothetical protein
VATSALDVRDAGAPAPRTPADGVVARRRPPAAVVVTAGIALVESVALLSGALTGLDGLLASPDRPAAPVVLLVLLSLAAWIVFCAGGAATLVDGAGHRMVTWLATGEIAALGLAFFVALFTPRDQVPIPPALPLPAVALLVLAVPVGKLLLAGSPTAVAWVAAGPRPRERRPDPARTHRNLCLATLAVIGIALGTVAFVGAPTDGGAGDPGSAVSSTR